MIRIRIKGEQGSGKTQAAETIKTALRAAGWSVDVHDAGGLSETERQKDKHAVIQTRQSTGEPRL